MDAPRLTRYPTTDGKEGWAKEIGNMVMPASSDEVALWKENERLRALLTPDQEAAHLEYTQLRAEHERWRQALLSIADDSDDIATYWAICDLIGEQPEPRDGEPRRER